MSKIIKWLSGVIAYILWWSFPRWSEDRFITKIVADMLPVVVASVVILGMCKSLGLEASVVSMITIKTPNGELKCTLEEASKAISEIEGNV